MTDPARSPRPRAFLLALATLALAGCAAVGGKPGVSYRNEPDGGRSFVRPQTPVPRAATDWQADRPNFVGLAISGGGSRSANFGMAALTELEQLGALRHVDAISAVSGGSIPTAWYAVHGDEPDWSGRGRVAAGSDFAKTLIGRVLDPVNLVTTTFTDYDRSDVLAELFESQLFGGRSITFGQLGPRGPGRPAVYFNATDTTAGGTRFVFSDQHFLRATGSDLSKYPIAWAMASSGAFPGVFNSVTLRRFSLDPTVRASGAENDADKRFLHLIDGGATDNLGVETLVELARQHHVKRLNAQQPSQGCLIMVVDSHVPNAGVAEMRQSDRRNFGSVLVDLNFMDAIDAMLSNRRDQTLEQLGIHRDEPQGQYNVELAPGFWDYKIRPYRRVGRIAIGYYMLDGRAFTQARNLLVGETLDVPSVREPERRQFECVTWHIALDEIQSIVPSRTQAGQAQALDPKSAQNHAVFAYRSRLGRMISQVSTSYRLTGPPDCSSQQLQDALYDAARIAVRQDRASTTQVCRWLIDRGMAEPAICRVDPEPLVRPELQVLPIRAPLNLTEAEQSTDRFVRCVRP